MEIARDGIGNCTSSQKPNMSLQTSLQTPSPVRADPMAALAGGKLVGCPEGKQNRIWGNVFICFAVPVLK